MIVPVTKEVLMASPYLAGQKQRFRITLELDVLDDFDPHQIDWNKVLDLQGNEKVSSYVEDLSRPDRWWILFKEHWPLILAQDQGFFHVYSQLFQGCSRDDHLIIKVTPPLI